MSLEERLKTTPLSVGEVDAERVAERATTEGLADVPYAHADSPLGPLLLATQPAGPAGVSYSESRSEDETLASLAARLSPRVIEAPARLDDARRQLDDYFSGRLTAFSLPIDWSLVGDFGRRVLGRTAEIPFGSVSTYGEVANAIGSPRGARAAGNALGSNPMPIVVPCHRVVASGGKMGGYTGGIERKELLLSLERGGQQLF